MVAVYKRLIQRSSYICSVVFGCILVALTLHCRAYSSGQFDRQLQRRYLSKCGSLCHSMAARRNGGLKRPYQIVWSPGREAYFKTHGVAALRAGESFPCCRAALYAWDEAVCLHTVHCCVHPNVLNTSVKGASLLQGGGRAISAPSANALGEDRCFSLTVLRGRWEETTQPVRMWTVFSAGALAAIAALGAITRQRRKREAPRSRKARRGRKAELLSVISQELHNPLSLIQICAENMGAAAPEESERFVRTIVRESGRLTRLATKLLDLSTLAGKGYAAAIASNDPSFILLSLFESYEHCAKEKRISLHVEIPAQTLPKLECDKTWLLRVLSALVENSFRYTPSGGHIFLQVERQRRYIAFMVSDSGIGIPGGKGAELYHRFYRGDMLRVGEEQHDLDLSIALGFVMLSSGELLVENSALGGAAFTARIPI